MNQGRTKYIALFILAFIFTGFLFTSSALASDINIKVNDKLIVFPDAKPFINQDNRTMVPVRFITEELGMEVNWDSINKTVTIQNSNQSVVLTIGKKTATVNDKTTMMDTAPVLVNNRTMVPIRFVSESFQANITWDHKSQTVSLVTAGIKNEQTAESKNTTDVKKDSEKNQPIPEQSNTSSVQASCKFGDLNQSPLIVDIPGSKYVVLQVSDLDKAASKLGVAKADLLSGKVKIATKVNGEEHLFEVKDVFEDSKTLVLETNAVISSDSSKNDVINLDIYKK